MTRGPRFRFASRLLALVACATTGQSVCTCPALPGRAQDDGEIAFRQALREATTDARVAVFAAHPDDEYLFALTFLRHRFGADAVAVVATRGEGGQNAVGNELWRDLGVLRTFETEASTRMLGSPVWFLNLPDTGFCRTAAEAIDAWGRDKAIKSMVVALRTLRPDVVVTLHGPDSTHGHDLGLLEILAAAIPRSADPTFAVDGLAPHAVMRSFCGASPAKRATIEWTTDVLDRLRHKTHREVAYAALLCHRTQAPGPIDQEFKDRYLLAPLGSGAVDNQDGILGGLPGLWDHEPVLTELARGLGVPLRVADLRREIELLPEAGAQVLEQVSRILDLLRSLERAASPQESELHDRLRRRIAALDRALRIGSGVSVRVQSRESPAVLAPGHPLQLDIIVNNASDRDLTGFETAFLLPSGAQLGESDLASGPVTIAGLSRRTFRIQLVAQPEIRTTTPARKFLYLSNTVDAPVQLHCRALLRGAPLDWCEPVSCEIRSPVDLEFQERDAPMAQGDDVCRVVLRVRKNQLGPIRIPTQRVVPTGWMLTGWPDELVLDGAGSVEQWMPIQLKAPTGERLDTFTVRLGIQDGPDAVLAVHRMALEAVAGLAVGIVRGPDDSTLRFLRSLGVNCRELSDEDLSRGEFQGLKTLLIDVRALGQRPAARAAIRQLLQFAEDGGRLVVLYHRPEEFNQESTGSLPAPYPLRLGFERVTRADAPVRVLLPEHFLLRAPHRIRAEDFDGWIHERALYLPLEHAPDYAELLSTGDPGRDPQQGSLLCCTAGKGSYVFCSLALHRQLRVCRDGAVRLFLNLLTN